ncbi:MAG: MarR family transcriptional regulator [Dehalococcoidales bacterium]|jgi:DNA-binding MarR family transcriptional regulator|nr:MarR family transcriptional regulator [Dehalococcoidales bacterium]
MKMKEIKINDIDYDLWLLLSNTHYRIKRIRAKELARYGISPEQAGILFFIRSSGNNAMPIEISRWQLREPQTITSILDRMEKKGLIKKSRDPYRKNVLRISLTEKGNEVLDNTEKLETFHKIMSVLSEEKRKILRDILMELMTAAKKHSRTLIEPLEEYEY